MSLAESITINTLKLLWNFLLVNQIVKVKMNANSYKGEYTRLRMMAELALLFLNWATYQNCSLWCCLLSLCVSMSMAVSITINTLKILWIFVQVDQIVKVEMNANSYKGECTRLRMMAELALLFLKCASNQNFSFWCCLLSLCVSMFMAVSNTINTLKISVCRPNCQGP